MIPSSRICQIKFDGDPVLKQIFLSDNLSEFIKIYKNNRHNILNHYKIIHDWFCTCDLDYIKFKYQNSKFQKYRLITRILINNSENIAKFIIHTEKINLYDLIYIIKILKKNKNLKKIFLFAWLYLVNQNNNLDLLFSKLIQNKLWDLIDYIHTAGHKISDISKYINLIPLNILNIWLNNIYKINPVNLITHPDINNFNLYQIINKINPNPKIIKKLYGTKPVSFIKNFEKYNSRDNFDYSCQKLNLPVILYLSNNYQIKNNNLKYLLFTDNLSCCKYFKIPNIKLNSVKINKIPEYQKYLINILSKLKNPNSQTNNILNNSLYNLIFANKYKLINYIQNNFEINFCFDQKIFNKYIEFLITMDDLSNLKLGIQNNIYKPINISLDPYFLDLALIKNSQNIIKYFSENLNMVCSDKILEYFKYPRLNSTNRLNILKNLELIGYPVYSDKNLKKIINILISKNDLKSIKYIKSKKNFIPMTGLVETSLRYNRILLSKYFIKLGQNYQKKNLIDRVFNKKNTNRYKYNINITNIIKYLLKLGGTATSKTINFLSHKGQFESLIILFEKFNLIPNKSELLDFLARDKSTRYMDQYLNYPEYLEYFKNNIKINIFENSELYYREIILNNFVSNSGLFKYFADYMDFKFDNLNIRKIIKNHDLDQEIINYIESKGYIPTKEIFLLSLFSNPYKNHEYISPITKYLYHKYKYRINIGDLHKLIKKNHVNINIINIFTKYFKINITPYTISLLLEKYINQFSNLIIQYSLTLTKKITQEDFNQINNSFNYKLQKFINNILIEIVEYEPTRFEIVREPANQPDINNPEYYLNILNNGEVDNLNGIIRFIADHPEINYLLNDQEIQANNLFEFINELNPEQIGMAELNFYIIDDD